MVQQLKGPATHLAASCAVSTLITLVVTGCGGSNSPTTSVSNEPYSFSADRRDSIDLGVVLANRDGYLCLPFEQIGLPPDADVPALKSSCDCIQPSLIEYVTPSRARARAVLLQYVPESVNSTPGSPSIMSKTTPMNLGVLIEFKLGDRTTRQFKVNLLHTFLAEQTTP